VPVEIVPDEGIIAREDEEDSSKKPSRKREAEKLEIKPTDSKKKRSLAASFRDPILRASSIEPFAFFRVQYRLRPWGLPELYDDYIVGPAIGDGDCFFHVVFTQDNQTTIQLTRQAENIRSTLKAVVMSYEPYKHIIRWEILAEYHQNFLNHKSIPTRIEEMFRDNQVYTEERSREQTRLCELESSRVLGRAFHNLNNKEREGIMDSVDRELRSSYPGHRRHEDEDIIRLISDQQIEPYLERYTQNSGPQSYIEIPVGQGQSASIANIIAESQNILIHCFLFDERQLALSYAGSLGNLSSNYVVSILYRPGHYWALYNSQMSENRRKGIKQTEINYNNSEEQAK